MIADGVRLGYSEAMIGAGTWKTVSGPLVRPWAPDAPQRKVIRGAAIKPWVDAMAARWPGKVRVN